MHFNRSIRYGCTLSRYNDFIMCTIKYWKKRRLLKWLIPSFFFGKRRGGQVLSRSITNARKTKLSRRRPAPPLNNPCKEQGGEDRRKRSGATKSDQIFLREA